jgi:hypothetical protein
MPQIENLRRRLNERSFCGVPSSSFFLFKAEKSSAQGWTLLGEKIYN